MPSPENLPIALLKHGRSSFAQIPTTPTPYVYSSIVLHAASNGARDDAGHLVITTALLLVLEYCLHVGGVG